MLSSCGSKELTSYGNRTLQVFNQTPVRFAPDKYPDGINESASDSVIHLTNGRIILKKITLPPYQRNVKVKAKVTLASNGDRWDKSGSCFVLPKSSAINLLNIAKGEQKFPAVDSTKLEKLIGVLAGENYKPTVELLRFMTPFGVGFYSNDNDSLSSTRKPVYIDKWAKNVVWEQDITDLYSMLEREAYVGIFIDTWTPEGYIASLVLDIEESQIGVDAIKQKHVEPLINTVYYMGQTYPDIFARKDVSTTFNIPAGARNVKLKYIVTGHGGHSGGDEFVEKRNIISIDGKEVLN
ncbi:MAG TPA: PNGase F N-terminal domain-containing protein, partial [Macellibacteroides fermentans]|nr:PNGase F N-terminal domain-containing protein [Macellibacteroides fermentans]